LDPNVLQLHPNKTVSSHQWKAQTKLCNICHDALCKRKQFLDDLLSAANAAKDKNWHCLILGLKMLKTTDAAFNLSSNIILASTQSTWSSKNYSSSTVATGKPRRTLFEAMETMATLMAVNKLSWCLTTTMSTCKAYPHGQGLIALKWGTNGIDFLHFPNQNILWEIPTRNSHTTQDTTIVKASNNGNDHHQHQPPLHSWTNMETTNHALLLLTPPCNDGNSFDYRLLLAELTAECDWMMQCWPLMVNTIDQGPCAINHNEKRQLRL